jgi:hypothetical protein
MDWSWVSESHQKRIRFAMKRTRIGFQGRFHPRVWVEFDRRWNLNWFRYHETWKPSDEFFCRSHRKSVVFLVILILKETSLELAFVVHLADPWSEDEGWSYREDHVVEVIELLDANPLKAPTWRAPTWRASCRCFTTDSLSQGYLGQLFGLRLVRNSIVNTRDSQFILDRALDHDRVIAFTSSQP